MSKNNYFKGWYFKCCANDTTIAFIPAYHRSKQGAYELTAKLIHKNCQPLYAPENGRMDRIIHESASCRAYYKFSCKGKPLCEFESDRASFEFEYTEY